MDTRAICRLAHRKQRLATGCAAHALYALTYDESFLKHELESSSHRIQIIAFHKGILLLALWAGGHHLKEIPIALWDEFAEVVEATAGLHIIVRMPDSQLLHSVAVQLEPEWEGGVWVSDSLEETPEHFTREGFLESAYARALLVHVGLPSDLEAHAQ